MFTSVRSPRVYEHIIEQVETAIFQGRLRSGDKLPAERELVRQFRVSRVTLREALRTLQHRGLVEVRRGAAGGYFVREGDSRLLQRDLETLIKLGRVSVSQLTEARLLVEPELARLAALRATEIELEALRAVVEERTDLVASGAHPHALDLGFHRLIAVAARNPVHAVLTGALMDVEASIVTPPYELPREDTDDLHAAHLEILDAIARREPERARLTMEAHIVDVQQRLQRAELARSGVHSYQPEESRS